MGDEPSTSRHHSTGFTEQDLRAAWEIISPDGLDIITKSQALESLGAFFPHITARDVRAIIGPGNLSFEKLRDLLLMSQQPQNAAGRAAAPSSLTQAYSGVKGGGAASSSQLDPDVEAFKILDPQGTGFVEIAAFKKMLQQMPGVGKIDMEDMAFIEKLVDQDEDGRVSLKDFAAIGSFVPEKEEQQDIIAQKVARLMAGKSLRPLS